jgi:hypothetical protein
MSSALASIAEQTTIHSPIQNPPLKRWNPRPPSDRDLQIYKMVKIQRAEQWAVAAKFNLHDSRVSQIIKKVTRWIAAGGSPIDPELRDHLDRQRVSRAIQRLRLVRAVELATFAVESETRPLKKTRRRWVGGAEVWCEETSIPQPEVSLAAVRLLLKAVTDLQDFDREDAAAADQPPSAGTPTDLLPAVINLLCTWRVQAEADGRVEPTQNIAAFVTSLLNNLLGTTLTRSASKEPAHSPLKLSAAPSHPPGANPKATEHCDDDSPPL